MGPKAFTFDGKSMIEDWPYDGEIIKPLISSVLLSNIILIIFK